MSCRRLQEAAGNSGQTCRKVVALQGWFHTVSVGAATTSPDADSPAPSSRLRVGRRQFFPSMSSRGNRETEQLRENIKDQLNRLLTQVGPERQKIVTLAAFNHLIFYHFFSLTSCLSLSLSLSLSIPGRRSPRIQGRIRARWRVSFFSCLFFSQHYLPLVPLFVHPQPRLHEILCLSR
jgi:hypothetical protein